MKTKLFVGSSTALVTPFDRKTKKINFEVWKKHIDFQIQNGTQALVFLGTTGEVSTLTAKERKQVVKFAVEYVAHRVPVIVGAGSNDTFEAIKKAKLYQSLGVDGLLIVTPFYNKCTQNGLIEHYTKIAKSTTLPIILYNVPSRTGVNITPQTVFELSKLQNIVAIKEASGNISQAMEIKRLCGEEMTVYSGEDALNYPMLSVGALGAISVVSNIEPKLISQMYKCFFENKISDGLKIHQKLLPLISALFCEVNPIPVKYALSLYGFDFGLPRLPLTELTQENKEKIQSIIEKI